MSPTRAFDLSRIHSDFPALHARYQQQPIVYLDNAATTHKPQVVIEAISRFYTETNANVHRASHHLSTLATQYFEQARLTVQQFINSQHIDEVIWTHGTTEAINLIANSYGASNLKKGDEILLTLMEHHANIVPWQLLAQRTGAIIKVAPITASGELDIGAFQQLLSKKTKIVSVCHVSNSTGIINPIKELIALAKVVNAITIIDGAQAVSHIPVDVQALGCDFYCFSGHKLFGPTGIGVLYGKRQLLEAMPPWLGGGEMIEKVSFEKTTFNQLPFKFEAGTPAIAEAIGLASAIHYINTLNHSQRLRHEQMLYRHALKLANAIPQLKIIGDAEHKISLLSFVVDGFHHSDIGTLLDQQGIAVRTGHHCTMPLLSHWGIDGTVRASFAFYNTVSEVDALFSALRHILRIDSSTDTQTTQATSTIINDILACKGWEQRYRKIMQLGKTLPAFPQRQRIESNLIQGCDSDVWLFHDKKPHCGTSHPLEFQLDSSARVIKGLAVIILSVLNGKSAHDILTFDVEALFEQLGLNQHLSPSRGNGLRAIVKAIKDIAESYLVTD